MIVESRLIRLCVGTVVAAMASLTLAVAAEFDLSPEQTGRIRSQKSENVLAAIAPGFKFVTDGHFKVAISPDATPPLGTYATDSRTVIGADPDIAQLIADKLGLQLELVVVAWEDWPLGLASGKYDAVINNVTVTEQRKKKFDFSTYRQDVLGFYVRADSAISSIKEPKDVAGLRIITSAGTNQEKIILEWDRKNTEAGLKPVEVQYFDDEAAGNLAVQSGRADVQFDPNAPLAYNAALTGNTKLVGIVNGGWPLIAEIAVATRRQSGLAEAITVAVNELIAEGEYAKALGRWSLTAETIDGSRVNPPGLNDADE